MSDPKKAMENFLQRAKSTSVPVVRSPINTFDAMFAVQELNDKDGRAIEKILVDGFEPGLYPEESVEQDLSDLKKITKELKAINKQGTILIGERIAKARDILKKYKDNAFRDWLTLTYGSYKSGYNYLAFFDLYQAMPDHLKDKLKDMPAKAAYVLASKEAPIDRKAAIIDNHSLEPAQNIITLIQETFGSDRARKSNRKPLIDKILNSLEKEAAKLLKRKDFLDPGQIQKARYVLEQLQSIFEAV